MGPHIHVSALNGFKTALYIVIFLGIIHIAARRWEGHPLANMILSAYA